MTLVTVWVARSTSAKPFQTLRIARWLALSIATPVTYPPPPENEDDP